MMEWTLLPVGKISMDWRQSEAKREQP